MRRGRKSQEGEEVSLRARQAGRIPSYDEAVLILDINNSGNIDRLASPLHRTKEILAACSRGNSSEGQPPCQSHNGVAATNLRGHKPRCGLQPVTQSVWFFINSIICSTNRAMESAGLS